MKNIILLITLLFAITIKSVAAETEVGISPDPYAEIWATATEEDIEALERVVWYESALADCPGEVNIAVVETVLNRCLSEAFEDTIKGVCTRKGQFYYRNSKIDSEAVREAIEYVRENGATVLPNTNYLFFATKQQTIGQKHIWIGERKENGTPKKGKGMYFCEGKR